jgi:hypothetical protein
MTVTAAPINFSEVSLWVRARETDQSIVREVSQRKLARALTPQQEATLKSQGASDSLVQSLRSPGVIAAPEEAATSETKSQPPRIPQPQDTDDSAGENLHIFEVSAGHPINLSQWGGPDYEFAFNVFRYAGENIVEPVVVDTVRTYTDVATYIGPLGTGPRTTQPYFYSAKPFTPYLGGDLKDDSYMIGDYIAATSHSVSRSMSIDKRNPVFIKGVPYNLYPIYGVRGVSLYYITNGTDSVKLAVSTSRR